MKTTNTQKMMAAFEDLVQENERLKRVIATIKDYLVSPRKTEQKKVHRDVPGAPGHIQLMTPSTTAQSNGETKRKRRARGSSYASDVEEIRPPQI